MAIQLRRVKFNLQAGAVKNKAQVWVFEALKKLRKNLPFPLLGLDSDSGSEFVKQQRQAKYATLNPAALKRKIDRSQQQLLKIASSTRNLPARKPKKFWAESSNNVEVH